MKEKFYRFYILRTDEATFIFKTQYCSETKAQGQLGDTY